MVAEVVSGGGRDPTSHALARLVGRVDLHVGVGIQFLGKFLAAEGAVEFYWLSMILLIVSCHAVNWTPRWLPVLKLSGFFCVSYGCACRIRFSTFLSSRNVHT